MANALYASGKEYLLETAMAGATNIKVVGIPSGYTVDLTNHDFYDDVTGQVTPVTTPTAIANVVVTKSGITAFVDGDDVLFSAVSGAQIVAWIIFHDTGSAATSELIAFIDTGTNIPITPNGGDITFQISANGFARLT